MRNHNIKLFTSYLVWTVVLFCLLAIEYYLPFWSFPGELARRGRHLSGPATALASALLPFLVAAPSLIGLFRIHRARSGGSLPSRASLFWTNVLCAIASAWPMLYLMETQTEVGLGIFTFLIAYLLCQTIAGLALVVLRSLPSSLPIGALCFLGGMGILIYRAAILPQKISVYRIDREACGKVSGVAAKESHHQEHCVAFKAMETGDVQLCEVTSKMLRYSHTSDSCFEHLAILKRDPSVCLQIKEPLGEMSRGAREARCLTSIQKSGISIEGLPKAEEPPLTSVLVESHTVYSKPPEEDLASTKPVACPKFDQTESTKILRETEGTGERADWGTHACIHYEMKIDKASAGYEKILESTFGSGRGTLVHCADPNVTPGLVRAVTGMRVNGKRAVRIPKSLAKHPKNPKQEPLLVDITLAEVVGDPMESRSRGCRPTPFPEWFEAAEKGDVKTLRRLRETVSDIEVKDGSDRTALLLAVEYGQIEAVAYLIAEEASSEALNESGYSLEEVASQGEQRKRGRYAEGVKAKNIINVLRREISSQDLLQKKPKRR